MAYCRNCGKLLPEDATRCAVCGAGVLLRSAGSDTGRLPKVYLTEDEPRIGRNEDYGGSIRLGSGAEDYGGSIRLGGQPQPLQPLHQPQPEPDLPPEAPKKKKKNGVLVLLYILLGVLVAALLGVGAWLLFGRTEDAPADPALGRYDAVSCLEDGAEREPEGEYVILKARGKAALYLGEEELKGTWELVEEALTVTVDQEDYTGTLEGDTLTLEVEDRVYTFLREGEKEDPLPEATEAPRAQDSSWWSGEWYGWWTVLEGTGEMYLLEGAAWDVCARISLEGEEGALLAWDEQPEQFRWDIRFRLEEGTDDRGSFTAVSGSFYGAELEEGSLTADPAAMPYGAYRDLLCLTGTYTDPDDPASSCTYCIVLRPWGTRWEDLATGDVTGMPYPDMLPIRYESWYLPLIAEGRAMPDTFE